MLAACGTQALLQDSPEIVSSFKIEPVSKTNGHLKPTPKSKPGRKHLHRVLQDQTDEE